MYLKDGNLVLRLATIEDAELLCKWWSDGKIMAHAGYPNGVHTDIEELIDKINKEKSNKRRLILEINSLRVGEMSYKIKENIAQIGIKICDFSYQEKGYGTKALKLLIKYLFDEMKVDKVILDTNVNNKRAQHVYEKIGFKKAAVRVDSWRDQLGVLQSFIDYEMKRENFIY